MWNYLSGVKPPSESEKKKRKFERTKVTPSGPRHFHLGYCFLIWASSLKISVAQLAIMHKKLIWDPEHIVVIYKSLFMFWLVFYLSILIDMIIPLIVGSVD